MAGSSIDTEVVEHGKVGAGRDTGGWRGSGIRWDYGMILRVSDVRDGITYCVSPHGSQQNSKITGITFGCVSGSFQDSTESDRIDLHMRPKNIFFKSPELPLGAPLVVVDAAGIHEQRPSQRRREIKDQSPILKTTWPKNGCL